MANERYDLDQLRADLACLESAVNVLERHSARSDLITVKISSIRDKIARLEAEADPWRDAKEALEQYRGLDSKHRGLSKTVNEYVDHLTAENAKLAKRLAELEESAVWGIHSQVDGHLIQSFLTREDAEKELEKDTSKPRFKEVRISTGKEIVKAITETQRLEKMFRVERDEAWSRIAELEAEIKAEDDADIADAEKELRLFAVYCARRVEHLMTDRRSKDAIAVAERFANGEATVAELKAARAAADVAADVAAYAAARAAACAAADVADSAAARAAARAAREDIAKWLRDNTMPNFRKGGE